MSIRHVGMRTGGRPERRPPTLPSGPEPVDPAAAAAAKDARLAALKQFRERLAVPCIHLGGVYREKLGCGPQLRTCNFDGEVCTPRAYTGQCADAGRGCIDCRHYEAIRLGKPVAPLPPPIPPRLRASDRPPTHIDPVPLPPLPAFTPTSRHAVVTCAVGDVGRELLAVSGPYLRAYASRIGADFHVIDGPTVPALPLYAKFRLGQFLDRYERVLFLDADLLVRPTCPDLFAVVPETHVGLHDDTPLLKPHVARWFAAHQERAAAEHGLPYPAMSVLSTGVVVLSRAHRELFDPPTKPFRVVSLTDPTKPYHCAEQDWVSLRLGALGYPLYRLEGRHNYQWWVEKNLNGRGGADIIHFAGVAELAGDTVTQRQAKRIAMMREVLAEMGG